MECVDAKDSESLQFSPPLIQITSITKQNQQIDDHLQGLGCPTQARKPQKVVTKIPKPFRHYGMVKPCPAPSGLIRAIQATHPTQWARPWPFNDITIYQGGTFKHLKRKKIMFNPNFGHYYYECMFITRSLCHQRIYLQFLKIFFKP